MRPQWALLKAEFPILGFSKSTPRGAPVFPAGPCGGMWRSRPEGALICHSIRAAQARSHLRSSFFSQVGKLRPGRED